MKTVNNISVRDIVRSLPKINFGFSTENKFKQHLLKGMKTDNDMYYYFEVENEEKEPGMPDILAVNKVTKEASFIEVKLAKSNGDIKFQPTQPRWYAWHPHISVIVVAWLPVCNKAVIVEVEQVIKLKKLIVRISIDEHDKVSLH